MLRSAMLRVARNQRVKRLVLAFPLTGRVVDRFVAGESLEACIIAVQRLREAGLLATVDHLGEDTTTLSDAQATTAAYLALLARLGTEGLAPGCEVSVKATALGLALPDGERVALANARAICAAADEVGTTVTLDMEDHTVTDTTLAIGDRLREDFPATGSVLQAYLRRTPGDCERYARDGVRIRLCKGAYDEPDTVAWRRPSEVSASYLACLRILMAGPGYPMVASHDPAIIDAAAAYAEVARRDPETFEFQMLYGIRTDEQARLAAAGQRVRVYVPYGVDWYGYFTRRLAERPANVAFFVRALFGR